MALNKSQNLFFDKTAKTLLNEQSFISSGCPEIDNILRGGFPKLGITQIYGQAGTGKSQIALQLCLSVQQIKDQDNNPYGTVYICTEAVFPIKRFKQMLKNSLLCKNNPVNTDLIFIEHIESVDELENYLNKKLTLLLNSHKIGAVIIDSIAAPFTVEYVNEELKHRAISLRKIGFQLHKVSRDYNLSVICLNQVRADLINADSEIAALGITWEHAITNSIYLYKINGKRFAQIVSSSYLPRSVFEFQVNDAGVAAVK